MDVMQLRRGLMMQGSGIIDVLRRLNILKGLNNYTRGYITSDGTIASASSATREVTSDFVENPFKQNEHYIFVVLFHDIQLSSSVAGWYGIGFYDNNKNFRARSANTVTTAGMFQKGDDVVGYVYLPQIQYLDGFTRFSYRTYGNAELLMVSTESLLTELYIPYGASEHVIFNDVPTS